MFASSLRGFLLLRSSHSHRLLHHRSPHPTDLQQLIRKQTNVSTTLANHLFTNKFPKSNIVFSPFAIHFTLSVLAFGSRGRTLDEILGFLKANTTDELKSLYSQLQSSIIKNRKSQDDGPELGFKNQVKVARTITMKPPPLKQVEDDKVHKAVFKVDHKTEGKWIMKFESSETKESDFNLLDGNKVQVPFMTNKEKQYVCEYDDFKILRCPYFQQGKQQGAMYFFLPNAKDGIRSLMEKISSTSDFFESHFPDQKVEMGKFLIPKLNITFNFEASDLLKELGLVLPFSEDAFTEIIDLLDGQNVYVSSMPQKIVMEMKEEDTKPVAASTFVEYECSPTSKAKMDFVADHPFLFVIRNDVTKTVTLMGQVIDPRVG